MEGIAIETGLDAQTLRRMARTADYYALREAGGCGLRRHDIRAASSSVEALMRLEKASRLHAAKAKRDVLTGRLGYKATLALLRRVKEDRAGATEAGAPEEGEPEPAALPASSGFDLARPL